MKIVSTGIGPYGTINIALDEAKGNGWRYLIIKTPKPDGRVGGSCSYTIYGTNNFQDLLDLNYLSNTHEIMDVEKNERMDNKELIRRCLVSMSHDQKEALITDMLVQFISGT